MEIAIVTFPYREVCVLPYRQEYLKIGREVLLLSVVNLELNMDISDQCILKVLTINRQHVIDVSL